MGEAIGYGRLGRRLAMGTIHRLEEEPFEFQSKKAGRIDPWLRENELQLLATGLG